MNKTIIINILGAPGVGKSTLSAEIFSILKKRNYIVEYVNEFAKDLVYKNSLECLNNQIYVSGIQHHKVWTILKYHKDNNIKNGVIITDSPLILGMLYYKGNNPYFEKFIIDEFQNFYPFEIQNFNYLILNQNETFEESGRIHNKEESLKIENRLKALLNNYNISYIAGNYDIIREKILEKFK